MGGKEGESEVKQWVNWEGKGGRWRGEEEREKGAGRDGKCEASKEKEGERRESEGKRGKGVHTPGRPLTRTSASASLVPAYQAPCWPPAAIGDTVTQC